MDRRVIAEEFVAWLETQLDCQVGWGDVPALQPDLPYLIVYDIPSPAPTGSWSDPAEDWEIVYQISSVGKGTAQVSWLSSKVHEAFLGRDAHKNYSNALPLTGCTVVARLSDGLGGIVKSGDHLFMVSDMYRLKVSPS